ncbi:hypothetical protein Y032_0011g1437 [Ancylostoma ceylanicum]|uniref:Uncharacterized protein n=1 Tax=Ancylostoma ceylanicum TaxID=53326 RepID=A0A016VF00_9BILA|nr:hypothetical protein Y032_0011g1437 [Ancylostoma ceylanicum]
MDNRLSKNGTKASKLFICMINILLTPSRFRLINSRGGGELIFDSRTIRVYRFLSAGCSSLARILKYRSWRSFQHSAKWSRIEVAISVVNATFAGI